MLATKLAYLENGIGSGLEVSEGVWEFERGRQGHISMKAS